MSWLVRYSERLDRLKSEAGSTLALWGDEFGDRDMLSLQETGFIDPSSAFDSTTLSDNDRPAISGGGSEFGKGESWGGQQDGTESVSDGRRGVGCASSGEEEQATGTEASGTVDGHIVGDSGAPKPRPMNTDEPEWDLEGDYMPLPAWKVVLGLGLHPFFLMLMCFNEQGT